MELGVAPAAQPESIGYPAGPGMSVSKANIVDELLHSAQAGAALAECTARAGDCSGTTGAYSLTDYTPQLQLLLSERGQALLLALTSTGEYWDELADFSLFEQRVNGQWRCSECPQPRGFDSRLALWVDHVKLPLLDWLNARSEPSVLILRKTAGGASWAEIHPGQACGRACERIGSGITCAWPCVAIRTSARRLAPHHDGNSKRSSVLSARSGLHHRKGD